MRIKNISKLLCTMEQASFLSLYTVIMTSHMLNIRHISKYYIINFNNYKIRFILFCVLLLHNHVNYIKVFKKKIIVIKWYFHHNSRKLIYG